MTVSIIRFFSGYIPQEWRGGNFSQLNKKGSRQSCSNYRPVTLTSQIVKLLERLVQDQLLTHVYRTITSSHVTNTAFSKNVRV